MGLFDLCGIPLNAFDVRGLSQDEMRERQYANLSAAQNYTRSPAQEMKYLMNLRQYQRPEKPLDERFADFKARLAAAMLRRTAPVT